MRSAMATTSPGHCVPSKHQNTSARLGSAQAGSWKSRPPAAATASPFGLSNSFWPACATRQKPCCNWCATVGVLRYGIGSAIPSSTRTFTVTGEMAWSHGHIANCSPQPVADRWVSLNPSRHASRDARHQGTDGGGDTPARAGAMLRL